MAAEKVKTKFNWSDREDEGTIIPCEHCKALDEWACCDDGSHSSACNYCDYNIILHCIKRADMQKEVRWEKVIEEIERHRRKTRGIDEYDLVGDCLDLIKKYVKEVEE